MRKFLTFALCFSTMLCVTGCEPAPRKHHTQHSRVYRSSDGRDYTRSYDADSNMFVWWALMGDSGGSSSASSSTVSWQRASGTPSGLTATSRAVTVNERGQPTEEEMDVENVPEEEMTDVDTTTSEAEAATSESATDSAAGSDAGDSGGGDSGGGDGGGGE